MSDEKNSPHLRLVDTPERAAGVNAKEPQSPRALVINGVRDAYQAGQSIEGIADAMKMGGVVVATLLTLMSLSVASSDGMSAFIGGIVVGMVAGVFLVVRCPKGSTPTAASSHTLPSKQST
jgi:hypothetical protein